MDRSNKFFTFLELVWLWYHKEDFQTVLRTLSQPQSNMVSQAGQRKAGTTKKLHPALVVILIIIILGILQIVSHKDSFEFLVIGLNPNLSQKNNTSQKGYQIAFNTPIVTKGQGLTGDLVTSQGQGQGSAEQAILQDQGQTTTNSSQEGAYVALCLMAKGEHKFLREWVQYHKYIGVQKMYKNKKYRRKSGQNKKQ
eukprot:TRINITY_DN8021_c1_g1_i4.p1 TRINITY_DN8021_c1_g1~~TRINITY_DN8021_c1_g1_i4.p1  ORF type:complete len:210 (+),score=18.50 TRINITY_DN8021_c1_g1_i4:44-631(+)